MQPPPSLLLHTRRGGGGFVDARAHCCGLLVLGADDTAALSSRDAEAALGTLLASEQPPTLLLDDTGHACGLRLDDGGEGGLRVPLPRIAARVRAWLSAVPSVSGGRPPRCTLFFLGSETAHRALAAMSARFISVAFSGLLCSVALAPELPTGGCGGGGSMKRHLEASFRASVCVQLEAQRRHALAAHGDGWRGHFGVWVLSAWPHWRVDARAGSVGAADVALGAALRHITPLAAWGAEWLPTGPLCCDAGTLDPLVRGRGGSVFYPHAPQAALAPWLPLRILCEDALLAVGIRELQHFLMSVEGGGGGFAPDPPPPLPHHPSLAYPVPRPILTLLYHRNLHSVPLSHTYTVAVVLEVGNKVLLPLPLLQSQLLPLLSLQQRSGCAHPKNDPRTLATLISTCSQRAGGSITSPPSPWAVQVRHSTSQCS